MSVVATGTGTIGRVGAEPVDALSEHLPMLPLEVRRLRYAVGGATRLDGVDLTLDDASGGIAIMGPNGAGKSLLLRLLNGLLAPDAGEILWNGRAPDAALRRRQAFVFQRPVLLRRSARANVEFVLALAHDASSGRERHVRCARSERAARADRLLERVGLGGRGASPARRLSGGEQQRLALACALATDPAVLLLDEPTASLDPASTAAIESIVRSARRRGTVPLLVTHDPGQARRLAASVVFLARGRVTEHTPADTFFDAPRSAEARDYLAGRLVL